MLLRSMPFSSPYAICASPGGNEYENKQWFAVLEPPLNPKSSRGLLRAELIRLRTVSRALSLFLLGFGRDLFLSARLTGGSGVIFPTQSS